MKAGFKVCVTILILIALVKPAHSYAQPPVHVKLSPTKHFYATTESFTLQGTVTNNSPRSLRFNRIGLTVYNKLAAGERLSQLNLQTKRALIRRFWYKNLPPGETGVSLTRDVQSLGLSEGVYPAELSVWFDSENAVRARSYVVIVDPKPEPLRVALVLDLHEPAQFKPDGKLADAGWLARISPGPANAGILPDQLLKLSQHPTIRVNLAVCSLLLRELEVLAGTSPWLGREQPRPPSQVGDQAIAAAKSLLEQFRTVAAGGQAEVLPTPYGYPLLPVLTAKGWTDDGKLQIRRGQDEVTQALGLKERPHGLISPGQRLSPATVPLLAEAGVAYTLGGRDQLADPPAAGTPLPPFKLTAGDSAISTFIVDDEIGSAVASATVSADELSALFASRLYGSRRQPGLVTIVVDGNPPVANVDRLYQFFEQTPWLQLTSLGSAAGLPQQPAGVADYPLTKKLSLSGDYLAKLDKSRRAYREFAQSVSRDNRLRAQLEDQLLIAESSDWLVGKNPGLGLDYLKSLNTTVDQQFDRIRLSPPARITFSGLAGKVPIPIINGNPYPVTVTLQLQGKDFSFSDDNVKKITLTPKENLVSYPIKARFAGAANLSVALRTSDRTIAGSTIEVRVSSTARYLLWAIGVLVGAIGLALILRSGRRR